MVGGSHGPMMGSRMVLGEVIGKVRETAVPVNTKVVGINPILDPKVAHSHGFGAFEFYRAVGNAGGSSVVGLDGCRALWITEFLECDTDGLSISTVVKEATEFGFGGGGHDFFEAMSGDEKGPVKPWRCGTGLGGNEHVGGPVAEIEETGIARPRFGFAEVGGVTVDPKVHVARMIADDSIGMRGGVVEEVDDLGDGGAGSASLFGGEGV
jgi:hypothetical protein